MSAKRYNTNPQEIYALELNKLQRSFSEMQHIGEGVSEIKKIGWKQIEYLRQMNFVLSEATMIGNSMLDF